MTLDDLKNNGWKIISSFGFGAVIVERKDKHMIVDKKTGEVIIAY